MVTRRLVGAFLVAEAILTLIVVYILHGVFSRHRIARLYGRFQIESPDKLDHVSTRRTRRIGRAIRIAGIVVPWQSTCLMDALAAKLMLNRRRIPSTLYIGFKPAESVGTTPIEGHAWLRSGNTIVTGAPTHRLYTAFSFYGNNHE